MQEITLFVESGSVYGLYTPDTAPLFSKLGTVTVKRASHVEPVLLPFRLLFHSLRKIFGEQGTIADITRKFPGSWRINMSPTGGPILPEHYRNRSQAIAAEIEYFNRNGKQ